jgi:plasmid maintenance system antidote protein VapI
VTAATALILARVFGNSPDFWLNVQRRSDLWDAMHSPRERKRIERARPLTRRRERRCAVQPSTEARQESALSRN